MKPVTNSHELTTNEDHVVSSELQPNIKYYLLKVDTFRIFEEPQFERKSFDDNIINSPLQAMKLPCENGWDPGNGAENESKC